MKKSKYHYRPETEQKHFGQMSKVRTKHTHLYSICTELITKTVHKKCLHCGKYIIEKISESVDPVENLELEAA